MKFCSCLVIVLLLSPGFAAAQTIPDMPLPEHPRPDFERAEWVNLNGAWDFRFDSADSGVTEGWHRAGTPFPSTITVPFSWGAPLSGLENEADIGWYAREITVPAEWQGRRVFLNIGAADWHTTAWLDGREIGTHQGGYTPFAFEITPHVTAGAPQRLVVRVDDTPHAFKLEGKQGYGPARGIWQTPYLEARGEAPIEVIRFTPDIQAGRVGVDVRLLEPASKDLVLRLAFDNADIPAVTQPIARGADAVQFEVPIPNPRLWSLESPFLYEVTAALGADRVKSYFGMREISVVDLPGTDIPYIALNGEPVYLQLALDQAYHPEGFYTFPSDEFIRDEILRSRQIGLNGLRVHIKVPLPRKLYWADRLGLLIMADVPNSWGEPDADMRRETEFALRRMIMRDYNHPSIFSWVIFNETWGLHTREGDRGVYRPETQEWVASMYRLARELDQTRLVEDNSVCCGQGHTETDINSWHAYLPGWAWDAELDSVSAGTFPGSTWNFEDGYRQGRQPNINSEFGNVWGYHGSTGDVDWSWDYHRAMNAFRRHPKVAGWLYTEHHDVINEWNGYWRYDRSEKFTGMDELADGMTLRDLHGPFYVATGGDLSRSVAAGTAVEVPLFASFMTGDNVHGDALTLRTELYGWDTIGRRRVHGTSSMEVGFRPWMNEELEPLRITMPAEPGVAVLALSLENAAGIVLHRNFTTFVVEGTLPDEVVLESGRRARLMRVEGPAAGEWSLKQWDVLDGLKVNGAGAGHFTYRVPWPAGVAAADVQTASFLVEASAKQLFGKDRDDAGAMDDDYMRGRGTFDPSRNPNAYPMTDETRSPSSVRVLAGGEPAGVYELLDDPADHRGILSWHSQLRDRRLREAGSYGQLIEVPIPRAALEKAAAGGSLEMRLEVDEALPGGLAIYGRKFGRYPLDPTLVLIMEGE